MKFQDKCQKSNFKDVLVPFEFWEDGEEEEEGGIECDRLEIFVYAMYHSIVELTNAPKLNFFGYY